MVRNGFKMSLVTRLGSSTIIPLFHGASLPWSHGGNDIPDLAIWWGIWIGIKPPAPINVGIWTGRPLADVHPLLVRDRKIDDSPPLYSSQLRMIAETSVSLQRL
jgi:hypothetical protein